MLLRILLLKSLKRKVKNQCFSSSFFTLLAIIPDNPLAIKYKALAIATIAIIINNGLISFPPNN